MHIILHLPQEHQVQKELAQLVGHLHAQSVLQHIHTLSCPAEQKLEIISMIKQQKPKHPRNTDK